MSSPLYFIPAQNVGQWGWVGFRAIAAQREVNND